MPWATAHPSTGTIVDVRAGRHACFDRLVIDVRTTKLAGFSVRYGPVYAQGTGNLVPLRGGASLDVVVSAPTYDENGWPVWKPTSPSEAIDVRGFETFRQVASSGSFEATTTIGVGVRARLPFHAWSTVTEGQALLVIDVAHAWPAPTQRARQAMAASASASGARTAGVWGGGR